MCAEHTGASFTVNFGVRFAGVGKLRDRRWQLGATSQPRGLICQQWRESVIVSRGAKSVAIPTGIITVGSDDPESSTVGPGAEQPPQGYKVAPTLLLRR